MLVCIGIDPSISSSGVVVQLFNDDHKVLENMYIIHLGKLKKDEEAVKDKYAYFKYICYDKPIKYEDNFKNEISKTHGICDIVSRIETVITEYSENKEDEIIVVIEGISYGSSGHTTAVYDLAGLNYLIRSMLLKRLNIKLYVVTPSELKKWVTGYGNCSKDLMIASFKASHRLFDIPKMDDIADAYFMSQYAHHLYKDKLL